MGDHLKRSLLDYTTLKPAYADSPCHCSEHIPMLRLTPEGIITCVNDCFCRITHFMAKDKLLGCFIGKYAVSEEDRKWFHEGLSQLREKKADVVRRECEVFSSYGYPITLDFVLMARRNMQDKLNYVSCILQDITPTKKNERRLMESLKEQERLNQILIKAQMEVKESLERLSVSVDGGEDFSKMQVMLTEVAENAELRSRRQTASLASVSHDIRTPLNAIVGFSELLSTAETQAEKDEYLVVIRNNSQLISDLLKGILDLEMLDAGQFRFQTDTVSLREIGQELCSTYNVVNQNEDVKVFFEENSALDLHLSTDSSQFRRILNNLIGNAIKNTAHGKVILSYQVRSGFVEFSVSDTGCGIPKDKIASIFNRYERIKRNYTGFGLGLAICRSLTDAMGGKIWVTSEEGKGSTFYFTLPLKE